MQRYGNNFEIILKYMQLVASLNHNHNNIQYKFIYKKPKYILLPKSKINYQINTFTKYRFTFFNKQPIAFYEKKK